MEEREGSVFYDVGNKVSYDSGVYEALDASWGIEPPAFQWKELLKQKTKPKAIIKSEPVYIQGPKGDKGEQGPAGWYVKLVNSGTRTHSETFITGQQTTYG